MARDDSILYTGAPANVRPRREQVRQEKLEQQTVITPAAKIVFDLIEKEKKNNADISTLIVGTESSEENIKSVLLAKQMYNTYLIQLQNQLKIILRAKAKKK